MPRTLRIEEPGLLHQVVSRAFGSHQLFEDDGDFSLFLELLSDCASRWGLLTEAFVLLPGHYELLVLDEKGMLSRAIRHLNGVYTQRFNKRHGRDGPIIRGRFRSRVVQPGPYAHHLVRQFHQAPVLARLARRPEAYKWSSHRFYMTSRRPHWLQVQPILEGFGGDRPGGRMRLEAFVQSGSEVPAPEAVSAAQWTLALGDAAFMEELRSRLRKKGTLANVNSRAAASLVGLTVDEVIQSACVEFKVPREQLVAGIRGQRNLARLVALLVCREETPATAHQIGLAFGIRPPTVAALAHRARQLLETSRSAKNMLGKLTTRTNKIKQELTRPR